MVERLTLQRVEAQIGSELAGDLDTVEGVGLHCGALATQAQLREGFSL